jgi:diguanylate cyclase (GGDEF)-like protein/PAS domain S-box-containing protein
VATILVVDDDSLIREFLVNLLGHRKHRLLEAGDGAEALAMVKVHHPDLVITDILMPTMDGFEFVQLLRADPAIASTAVVFFTAQYHKNEAEALAKSCGVACILTKPCASDLILQVVEELLGTRQTSSRESLPPDFAQQHLSVITDKLSKTADELRMSNHRLAALVDINLNLASERNYQQLLSSVCPAARSLFGAKYAALAARPRDGASDVYFVTSGMDSAAVARLGRPELCDGVVGSAFVDRRPRRLTNPRDAGLPLHYPAAHSLLVAPIVSPAHVHGWICLTDKIGADEFSAEDERLLTMLAAQVGRVYESERLHDDVRQHAARLEAEIGRHNQAQAALTESEKRFREMAENIRDVFFLVDARSNRTLYISPAYAEIWGRSCESLYADPDSWAEAVHPEDRASAYENFKAGMWGGKSNYEYRIVRPDRSIRWIGARVFPIRGNDGGIVRVAGVAADITERKQDERAIRRLNRVYAMLSRINTLSVRVGDREALFREACRTAVEAGAFKMAWIGVVDPQTLDGKIVAWHGGEEGYVDKIRLTVREGTPDSERPACRALRQSQPVICNDIATDVSLGDLKDELLERGHRSLGCFPLMMAGRPAAVIALFAGERGAFDEEETRLLLELSADISLALDHIEKEERLNYLAYYDALTGLANRNMFLERVAQHLRDAVSGGHKVAVALVDLERFKNVNHSLGRPAGDALLKQVANWLRQNVGDTNLLARMDADHFAVVLPRVNHAGELARLLEKTTEALLQHPFRLNDAVLRIAAKTGVALFPDDGADADTLLKNAEAALKKAKTGGDRYVFYAQKMTETMVGRLDLENQLREALDKEEFVLHYQPKVSLLSGKLTGVEALVRWNDPRTGLVPPGRFIPIMEETGLINELGAWALRQAIEDYLLWRNTGLAGVRISVNVSQLQLRNRGFIAEISAAIGIDDRAPGGLELEITESVVMEDVKHSIGVLQSIRAMGISIAIDDFGTGFSSLSHLSKLPVDTLKIDRSFVDDMTTGPEGLALVSTIINLAHSLKLKVVAEGVETEEQSRLLRLLDCDEMQGYLFCRPVPREIFEARYLGPATAS